MNINKNLETDQAQLVPLHGHRLWLPRAHVLHCLIFFPNPLGRTSSSPTPHQFQKLTHPKEPETTPVYTLRVLAQLTTEPMFSCPRTLLPTLQAI